MISGAICIVVGMFIQHTYPGALTFVIAKAKALWAWLVTPKSEDK